MAQWSSQKNAPKKEIEEVIVKPIEYKTIDLSKRFGLNIAIIGLHMRGKSLLAAMFGYFNSKYVSKLDPKKFANTIKLLKGGYMPEVEKIIVLDLDNSFEQNCSRGVFRDLLNPFFEEGILYFRQLDIPERQQKIIAGEIVDATIEELDEAKNNIEMAIKQAVKNQDPNTLYIIDSMSSYDEVLNNRFKIIFEKVANLKTLAATVDMKLLRQAFWTIRNAWWNDTMKTKRNYPGWQIDTYKVTRNLNWVKEKQKAEGKKVKEYYIQWGSPNNEPLFNLDQVYWLHRDVDGFPYVDIFDARYKSKIGVENINIRYELKKKNAGLILIEKMAPYLMGEAESDDDMW